MRDFLVHLRLPFQLALSVVTVWGLVWGVGSYSSRFWWVWLAWTVALSGGATAYNSYFDRDEGPVSGLRRPPKVRPSLLWMSLWLQLAGALVLAVLATWVDVAVYALGAMLFLAYSTPGLRTKSGPWGSTVTVSLGSGAAASLAGSLAGGGESGSAMRLGMLSATLFIAGFYPLTQLGQIAEDRRRGDRTFAVALGRNVSFLWAAVLLPIATGLDLWWVGYASSTPGRVLLGGSLALAVAVVAWWRNPRLDSTAIADWLAYGAAAVFALSAALV